jgi:DNA repair exonuclease SbcCD ATPase subunit
MLDKKLLKFNYVKLKNFFSYKEAHLTLNDKGLIAVSGYNKVNKKSNGAGKSALIAEAIVFALFGETIRKMSITKIPNRFTKSQCSVELNFELQGHSYTIIRTRRPDSLQFYIDDVLDSEEDKSLGDSRDTNKKIIDIIDMGLDEFVNSILFGQNIQKYFFLLNDAKQKDMLDNIIDIKMFDTWKGKAKDLATQFDTMKQKKVIMITNIEQQITDCTQRIIDIEKKEANYIENKNVNYDIEVLQKERIIYDLINDIFELEKKYNIIDYVEKKKTKDQELKLVDGIGKLTTLISSAKQLINKKQTLPIQEGVLSILEPSITESLEDLITKQSVLTYEFLSYQTQIKSDTDLLVTQGNKIKSVESLLNSECPTCSRQVDTSCVQSIKEAYVTIIETIENKIKDIEIAIQTIKVQLTSVENAIIDRKNQVLYNDILIAQQDVEKYSGMKDILAAQLSSVQVILNAFDSLEKANTEIQSQISYQKSQKIAYENQIQVLKDKKNSITSTDVNPFGDLKSKELDAIKLYNIDIEKLHKEIETIQNYDEACIYWTKAFGDKNGVKSYIYERVFPYLNDRCNHYLGLLSNGEITAEISLDDKDRFVVKTENIMGADVYGANSGGEKRRIDLAVMFALHDLVASRKYHSNILILDEIFDNLDINGIDTAMAVLEDIISDYDSIFVISHTDMQEYFDNHLYIIKDGNTSYLSDTIDL